MTQSETAGSSVDSSDHSADDSTWQIVEGQQIAPGYFAWDLLSVGKRFEVWAAWSLERLTPVCIKIPRRDQFTDSTVNALHREHDATASFDHPAIPRVFAADFAAAVPYLVLEFIEGDPLGDYIHDHGPQGTDEVLHAGLQVLAALRHIHGRGFVHHDLKPGNIMIRGERAIVIDYDLSLPIGVQRSRTKPRGTHSYMSPEQIQCAPASPSMDIFGLGAVLYRLASGTSPFKVKGTSHSELSNVSSNAEQPRRYIQLEGTLAPAIEAAPHLAPSVAAAIDTLLTVDHRDRPATADEAIALLTDATPPESDGMWPQWVTRQALRKPTAATSRRQSQVEVITGSGAALGYCTDLATSQRRCRIFFDRQLQHTPAVAELLAVFGTSPAAELVPVAAGADKTSALTAAASQLRWPGPEHVVAIGGGLTADVARLITLIGSGDAVVTNRLMQPGPSGLIRLGDENLPAVPLAVISTTLGTGAEVSPVACFSHDGVKRIVVAPLLQPTVAILDPGLTRSLPHLLVEQGLIEALLRYVGPLLAGPSTVPTADKQALTEAKALRSLLLVHRSGGLSDDERLEVAIRSANTRLGFALAGRDPFSSKLWYLATALTDVMPISKIDAHLLLLPVLCERIELGDTRFGSQDQLDLVTNVALGQSAPGTTTSLVAVLGAPTTTFEAFPAPDLVADHCTTTWAAGQPMLGMFTSDELQTFYEDAFTHHRKIGWVA